MIAAGVDLQGGSVSFEPAGMTCVLAPEVARWLERAFECLKAGEFEDAEVGFQWMHLVFLHAADEAARLAAVGQGRDRRESKP